jgi:predicted transcriptional regulator
VDKTTVYLPVEIKTALKRVARRRRISEAELIRESIRAAVEADRPRARGARFTSDRPVARELDRQMPGLGER